MPSWPTASPACEGDTWDLLADLAAPDEFDRYAAVKAAGADAHPDQRAEISARLGEIADDTDEDPRIRLEAAGSLARLEPDRLSRVAEWAELRANDNASSELDAANGMEAIFILSELGTAEAAAALDAIGSRDAFDSEARCSAVWGLGRAGIGDSSRLLPYLADEDDDVAMHALAGFGELDEPAMAALRSMLERGGRSAESAAALLARGGGRSVPLLIDVASGDGEGALAAQAALTEIPEGEVRAATGGELDPALEAILAPVWAKHQSWLNQQTVDTPVEFLARQTVRHLGSV